MPQINELSLQEMRRTTGGDWFEVTWGIMLGAAFAAGAGVSSPVLGVVIVGCAVALLVIPVN